MREWISKRLKELGKTKGALAAHLNVAPARMTELSQGKRELQSNEILPFSNFLEMDPVQVLALLDDPKANPDQIISAGDVGSLKPSSSKLGFIPIRGVVAAGCGVSMTSWLKIWTNRPNTQTLSLTINILPRTNSP